jgi:hypothetical protein
MQIHDCAATSARHWLDGLGQRPCAMVVAIEPSTDRQRRLRRSIELLNGFGSFRL